MTVERAAGPGTPGRSEDVFAVHALTLPLALLVTVCLPVVVAALVRVDALFDGLARRAAVRRTARGRRCRSPPARPGVPVGRVATGGRPGTRPGDPGIEQLAAELRRLGSYLSQLSGDARSWREALLAAYDDRLRLASRRLGVAEYLADLEGVDRDIERVRVEGELEAAGLVLRDPHPGPRRPAS